jgi:DNA-binding CsgD family transcriptional regulator
MCLSHGLTEREAADVLGIAYFTVRKHTARARLFLAAKTNTHAVALAIRMGLID